MSRFLFWKKPENESYVLMRTYGSDPSAISYFADLQKRIKDHIAIQREKISSTKLSKDWITITNHKIRLLCDTVKALNGTHPLSTLKSDFHTATLPENNYLQPDGYFASTSTSDELIVEAIKYLQGKKPAAATTDANLTTPLLSLNK
ncbi:MAG TPA: hypothetical protein VJK30_01690 [Coxiellaceae bacterium]|nr:MAG: hypothetical protein A3E81_04255 [Gammaproteobacteria bacterium RIFCSPHIGHO2_12_FULL_36_30]HLB56031.1 hypothetical protein [Coxiellaceae bacterium]